VGGKCCVAVGRAVLRPPLFTGERAGEFQNGTGRGLGRSFVGLYDPFGECRFSRAEVSLVYDVLPAVEILQASYFQ
jgi:hypothetical protein